jgi:hypothetical protein
MWDKIDSEVGSIFTKAELALKTPKQRKAWSPTLASAGAEKRYWKVRLAHAQRGQSYGVNLLRKCCELKITDDLTNDISELQSRHDRATKNYERVAQRDDHLRAEHLKDMITSHQNDSPTSLSTLKALKSLAKSEAKLKMFSRIKATFKPLQTSSVSRVDVPADLSPFLALQDCSMAQISTDNGALKNILTRTIRTRRQDGTEEWTTIFDQQQLETAILLHNFQHFQQAKHTPFGSGFLSELISSTGLTSASNKILQGTLFENYDSDLFPELRTFILELAIPEPLKSLPALNTELA